MNDFYPIKEVPSAADWTSKDVLVVFGELFQRGYANGIVDMAKEKGMKIIYSTVGRRDQDQQLRALTTEELKEKEQPLINIPLEAGFDLSPDEQGKTPVDQLKGVKMSKWNEVQFDWNSIEQSQTLATTSFCERVKQYMRELETHIPEEANILFVHTMAGGFPRAKVVMPVTNKVFKGFDERFCSSETFWQSDIGKLCDLNFKEVTGETLQHLIDSSSDLRKRKTSDGKKVSYVAYGYHGTEVLIGEKYRWQSYSPYLQGWAKLHLEDIAKKAQKEGISACVFNAPEILTNSSSIFLGVEVSLYPLLAAFKKENFSHPKTQELLSHCQSLLKADHSIDDIIQFCTKYLGSDTIKKWSDYSAWPQHNGNEQMKLMRQSSSELIAMHSDVNDLITAVLSEVVFKASGKIMFNQAWNLDQPVLWMGHDIIAKQSLT